MSKLTSMGIFTLVPKAVNGSVLKESRISTKGACYDIFQWGFGASIETNEVLKH